MSTLATVTLPMFRRFPSDSIDLIEILSSLRFSPRECDEVTWSLTQLNTVPLIPSPVCLLDLEAQIDSSGAVRFAHDELVALAVGVNQILDCDIAGRFVGGSDAADTSPAITIEAFDSTEWTVSIDPARAAASLAGIRELAETAPGATL